MEEPKSLDSLFKEKIFRIPDYQRGYAWRHDQLKAFWEDLVNLSSERSHYTGVLTLKQIPDCEVSPSDKEYWLVADHSYKLFNIVDGQQRLTTFIIFLKSFVDLLKALPENSGKSDEEIYISDTLNVTALQAKYLFMVKPTGDHFRTYKFGYTVDNPSYQYLRYRILDESNPGLVQETFYTLNLSNAKTYFYKQLEELHKQEGTSGLQRLYAKLTKRFLFNEYVIKDEFDVFVAFETMNNRGKKLSDLELLKNRLIYLTTLYDDKELDPAERKSMRDTINDAWKEVYYQLGRNKTKPLNDDEFLQAHWTMYFKYSRQTGRDYIQFLLGEQFTPQKIHKKVERDVELAGFREERTAGNLDDADDETADEPEEPQTISTAQLRPSEISNFVLSLKESVVHWFNSWNPHLADGLTDDEQEWLERLNRVGIVYFRPLVMAILKHDAPASGRVRVFKKMERFIFLAFRLSSSRANYRSSEFYNAARALDRKDINFKEIERRLDEDLAYTFNEDGTLRIDDFYNLLFKKFKSGGGYYKWSGLRYFLYEYELSLFNAAVQQKVNWDDLLKTDKDKISIEHIYPQTETHDWARAFKGMGKDCRTAYSASIGNLVLLSSAINSSLQNDTFAAKKSAKFSLGGSQIRHGYCDGSHSEIEVSQFETWGPDEIRERGLRLLSFMEKRWDFSFRSDDDRNKLLFLSGEAS
jgi:hypothetical protein